MPSVEGGELSEQIHKFRILTCFLGLAADHCRPGLRVPPLRYSSSESGGTVSTVKVGAGKVKSKVRGSSTRVVLFLP